MSTTTDNRTLATQHADSLLATIQARVDAGALFGFGSARDDMGFYDTEAEAIEQGIDPEDVEPASAMDYLHDMLDIHYTVGSDRTYRSARILVSFGGPNVWIDTGTRELEVHWDGFERRALPASYCHALDDAIAELWDN